MPQGEQQFPDSKRISRSRLGESLIRLQRHLVESRRSHDAAEDDFLSWQERWAHRRDQIAHRLELIDSQLEQLVQDNTRFPQLTLVGSGVDD
jgi:L-lactate utilization protein LutB